MLYTYSVILPFYSPYLKNFFFESLEEATTWPFTPICQHDYLD